MCVCYDLRPWYTYLTIGLQIVTRKNNAFGHCLYRLQVKQSEEMQNYKWQVFFLETLEGLWNINPIL